MPTAVYNKFNAFVEHMAEGVHDLGSDQLIVALSPAADAPVATDSVLADLTEISYTNLSTRNLTRTSSSQSAGVYSLVLVDHVLTASGNVATFRYVSIYNDTPISPADPLICWFDYGANVTLTAGESLTLDFGTSLFTLT